MGACRVQCFRWNVLVLLCTVITVGLAVEEEALGQCTDSSTPPLQSLHTDELAGVMRAQVVEMFEHAYDGYLIFAYPLDELRSLSCTGVNTLSKGGFYLTLIDALDTLVVLGKDEEFCKRVSILSDVLDFDLDINISVFETTIRIVGGLLSAHLLIEEGHLDDAAHCTKYEGELLVLAYDLGLRILPAFDTSTGIPYGTVNLRYGVPPGETTVTSLAGGGTQILEFAVLTRLTGDKRFEKAAKRAMRALFNERSHEYLLLGNHIDIETAQWTHQESGIGGNTDSYYEYLLKAYTLLNEREWLDMFYQCLQPILDHVYKAPWFVEVQITTGGVVWPVSNSLGAFLPGMLFRMGAEPDIRTVATESLAAHHYVWRMFGSIPEGFHVLSGTAFANQKGYPLRPELAESIWQAYRTTKDPAYLRMATDMVTSINNGMRTKCGFAVIEDVETGEKRDSMESFLLAETFKYLYLIFAGVKGAGHVRPISRLAQELNNGLWVLNTEGHPFPLTPLFSGIEDHNGSLSYPPGRYWAPLANVTCQAPSLWDWMSVDGYKHPFLGAK